MAESAALCYSREKNNVVILSTEIISNLINLQYVPKILCMDRKDWGRGRMFTKQLCRTFHGQIYYLETGEWFASPKA